MFENKRVLLISLCLLFVIFFFTIYGKQHASIIFCMWIPTVFFYGLTKALLLWIGRFKIREIYFGLPLSVVYRFKLRGVTYLLTALPIFPFIYYEGLKHLQKQILGVLLNIITPILLLVVISSIFSFFTPFSDGNVKIISLLKESPLIHHGIREDDIVIQVGEKRIVNVTGLASAIQAYQGEDTSMVFLRDGKFLPSIDVTIPQNAIGNGKYMGMVLTKVQEKESVIITKVWSHSPAEAVGLKEGDIIIEVDNKKIGRLPELVEHLKKESDHAIKIIVIRDGQILPPMELTPDERKVRRGVLGLRVSVVNPLFTMNTNGARIMCVFPDTPASRAGLKCNDIIIKVDNEEINSLFDCRNKSRARIGTEIPITVLRNKNEINLRITPRSELSTPLGILYQPHPLGSVRQFHRLSQAIRQGIFYAIYNISMPLESIGLVMRKLIYPPAIHHAVSFPMASFIKMVSLYPRNILSVFLTGLIGFIGVLAPYMILLEYLCSFFLLVRILFKRTLHSIVFLIIVLVVSVCFSILFDTYYFQIYEVFSRNNPWRILISSWVI